MARFKAIIDGTSSKSSISIRLDDDVYALQEEVKELLKKAHLGKLNMNRSLQPILKSILEDAKFQALEAIEAQEKRTQSSKTTTQKVAQPEPA